jgi:hypothetical protein
VGKAPLDRCHMDRCPLDRLDVEQLAVDRVQLELGGLTTEVVVARNDSSRFVIGESAKHRIVVAVQPKADRRVAPPVMPQRTQLVKVIHGRTTVLPAARSTPARSSAKTVLPEPSTPSTATRTAPRVLTETRSATAASSR